MIIGIILCAFEWNYFECRGCSSIGVQVLIRKGSVIVCVIDTYFVIKLPLKFSLLVQACARAHRHTQLFQHSSHCWKHLWKSSFAVNCRHIMLEIVSSVMWKIFLFIVYLNVENSQKSHINRSEEWAGCFNTLCILAKNWQVESDVVGPVMAEHPTILAFFSMFQWTASLKCCKIL